MGSPDNLNIAREMFLRCVEVINGVPVINLYLAEKILTKAKTFKHVIYSDYHPSDNCDPVWRLTQCLERGICDD